MKEAGNLLVRKGTLVRRRGGRWFTQAGDVRVRIGRIARIAAPGSLMPQLDEEVFEAQGSLVMPGLVNAHLHSYGNLYRMPMPDAPLEVWLVQAMAGRTSASERAYYVAALLASAQLLRAGVTTVLDHVAARSSALDATTQAYQEAGVRAVIAPQLQDLRYYDTLPQYASRVTDELDLGNTPPTWQELLDISCDFAERWQSVEGVSVVLGPSAPQRCSEQLLRGVRELAERLEIGVHMHLLETRIQKQVARERHAGSTVRYLDKLGLLTERTSFAHAIWVSEEEIHIMADRGASVVHCPASNLLLGSGVSPLSAYRSARVTVGLGTDGPNCSGTQNVFESMKLAIMLQRLTEPEPSDWLLPADALSMATEGGGAAVGLEGSVGAIEMGHWADLVVVSPDQPALVPLYDAVAQLVLSERGQSVQAVVVGGRIVLQDGKLSQIDEAALIAEAKELSSEIKTGWSEKMKGVERHIEIARGIWRGARGEMPHQRDGDRPRRQTIG